MFAHSLQKHFHPQSYETKENGKRGFRPSAVPEIFSEETRKRFPKNPPLSVSGKRAIRRPAKYGASHKRVGSSRVRVPQDRYSILVVHFYIKVEIKEKVLLCHIVEGKYTWST